MIIVLQTQFHIERPWGQRPYSIVSYYCRTRFFKPSVANLLQEITFKLRDLSSFTINDDQCRPLFSAKVERQTDIYNTSKSQYQLEKKTHRPSFLRFSYRQDQIL